MVARQAADGARLAAFVSVQQGQTLDMAALRALVAALPDYMLPSSITVLDALPLNANGKVDRKALPEVPCRPWSTRPTSRPRAAWPRPLPPSGPRCWAWSA